MPLAKSRRTAPTQDRITQRRAPERRNWCSHPFLTQPNPIRNGPAVAAQARAGGVGAPAAPDPREEPAEREAPAELQVQAQAPDAARLAQQARVQEPRPEPPVQAILISIRRTTSRAPSFRHPRRQPPQINKSSRRWRKAPADSRSLTLTTFSVACSASARSRVNFTFWDMCPTTRRKARATR